MLRGGVRFATEDFRDVTVLGFPPQPGHATHVHLVVEFGLFVTGGIGARVHAETALGAVR